MGEFEGAPPTMEQFRYQYQVVAKERDTLAAQVAEVRTALHAALDGWEAARAETASLTEQNERLTAEQVDERAKVRELRQLFHQERVLHGWTLKTAEELYPRVQAAERDVARLEQEKAEALAERNDIDLSWAAASEFVRDVIEALGMAQPPVSGAVNLPALTLQMIGQIEEGKSIAEAAERRRAELEAELLDVRTRYTRGHQSYCVCVDCAALASAARSNEHHELDLGFAIHRVAHPPETVARLYHDVGQRRVIEALLRPDVLPAEGSDPLCQCRRIARMLASAGRAPEEPRRKI